MIKVPFVLAAGFLVTFSAPAFAEDRCNVKAVLGGKPVAMNYCAASVYEPSDGMYSVTLWFSDAPFNAKEVQEFHENSAAPDKTADGKPRTAMHFAFCSGVGKAAASAAAVKSVETGIDVAGAPLSGRQWVFELPKEKDVLKIEKLTGNIAPGGTLSGRVSGGKVSDGLKYSWDADFHFTLPAKGAFGGMAAGAEERRGKDDGTGFGPQPSNLTGTGATRQICSAYSRTARSDENGPMAATLRIDIRVHAIRSEDLRRAILRRDERRESRRS